MTSDGIPHGVAKVTSTSLLLGLEHVVRGVMGDIREDRAMAAPQTVPPSQVAEYARTKRRESTVGVGG